MARKQRFKTLETLGPTFPAPYMFKGATLKGIKLSPLAEEMLFKLSRYIGTDYWTKNVFLPNAWTCIKPELPTELQKLSFPEDFMPLMNKMKEISEREKEAKKNRTKEEKLKEKEEKEKIKKQYGYALVDGQKVAIGAFLVEDASFIITRGEDPRCGLFKYRVDPSMVTLNIVNGKPPAGWKGKVESDPKGVWVFKYQQLCGVGNKAHILPKVVAISKNTDIGKQMTNEKYLKANNILTSWKKIESFINKGLKSKSPEIQESAIIAALIAETGIRIGGERDLSMQADTQGMSTLRVEHIKL